MTFADELQKLHQLRNSGALTEAEFQTAKEKLSAGGGSGQGTVQYEPPPAQKRDLEKEGHQWGLFIHLSQFASYIFPLAGVILPIILWQIKKNELPGVDAHGRIVMNWFISGLIYGMISAVLVIFIIGIPMLFALIILAIVYPIVGAVKANDGIIWKYPGSITFFSIDGD
jgi:uncharacterized Tic20 family protein